MLTYGAKSVEWVPPMFYVYTATPPTPIPLTIGGLGCRFAPADHEIKHLIRGNTNYPNPRLPDPISWNLPKWTRATSKQLGEIHATLSKLADITGITVMYPFICVKIEDNERGYQRHSLPGVVAGVGTVYHHSQESMWPSRVPERRERFINTDPPSTSQHNLNDYIVPYSTTCSCVRLEFSLLANHTKDTSLASSISARVPDRCTTDGPKLTVANHRFLGSNEVYHPINRGIKIGEINERWPAQDIALVSLNPTVRFDTSDDFQVQVPTHLLVADEIKAGAWYGVEEQSSGLIFLQNCGVRVIAPPRALDRQSKFSE